MKEKSVTEVLVDLQSRGIVLTLVENKLKVKAPKGAMTPEIKAALSENKDALIALIQQAAESKEIGAGAGSEELCQAPYHLQMYQLGGQFVPLGRMETPWYYQGNSYLAEKYGDRVPNRNALGANGSTLSPIAGYEHLALRDSVGLTDWGWAIGLIDVSGPGAVDYLNTICSAQINVANGALKYTLFLTEQGTIKRDVTILRVADDQFWILNGKANMAPDLAYMNQFLPTDGSVKVEDQSSQFVTLGLWGPNARKVLAKVTQADLSNEAFPFYTSQDMIVGRAPAKVARLSYAGELGYEIYAPTDFGGHLWDTISAAGQEFNLVPVGASAIFSLRIEKGYLLIGSDISMETNPYEAGLSWLVSTKKPHFIGREACLDHKKVAPKEKLVTLTFDDPSINLYGYEQVSAGDQVIGHVASGAYGYSVGKFIALGWLETAYTELGTPIRVRVGDTYYDGIVDKKVQYDPKGLRMKA